VKNQHGIRPWLAVSKTLKFAKVGSLNFHCFGTAVVGQRTRGQKFVFSRLGIAELFWVSVELI
jgi:hypothetical protein